MEINRYCITLGDFRERNILATIYEHFLQMIFL